MSNFTKGQAVTQVLPEPIAGEVAGFALDQDTGDVIVLVEYTDANGELHSRYFRQEEIA